MEVSIYNLARAVVFLILGCFMLLAINRKLPASFQVLFEGAYKGPKWIGNIGGFIVVLYSVVLFVEAFTGFYP